MNKIVYMAMAGALALSVSACNSYDRGDRALGGAALGGLAGAAIGGAATGDGGGALAGAALGAAGGAVIGSATTPERRYYRSGYYRGDRYYRRY
jgi:Outer membrane lipoprotein